jgi:monoamine oxidase
VVLGGTAEAEVRRRRRRHRRRVRRADVAIVGAGFAGLTAATELMKAGRSVVVLESRNRVGGKVLNHSLGGNEETERGGTFTGPTQNYIMGLAQELGVELFPQYATGDNVYFVDGERSTYNDSGPTGTAPPDPLITGEVALAVTMLDQMATEVDVNAPWESANAASWDSQTLGSWVDQNSVSERFRRIVPVATRPIFGAEPRELSLLFTLFYIAASGDENNVGTFERNFNTRDGAQMFRFVGGSQILCEKLAQRLGRRVVLRSPVGRIVQGRRGVRVDSKRLTVRAKRVVVTAPSVLAARIDYTPELPEGREQLGVRLPQGRLVKVTAVYDRPFWRDEGLNGTAVSFNGPVNVTYDDCPPDGSPGVLFGFVGGDEARRFVTLPAAQRRAEVLKNLTDYFGPQAGSPREYLETNWVSERWSRGGPTGIAGPGTLLSYGPALRRPFGRVHWAGTETASYWNGYMDGAIRSGKRVAEEVLASL